MGGEDEEGGVWGMLILFGPDHGGDVEGEVGLVEGDGGVVGSVIDADADGAMGADEELVAEAVGVFSADRTGDMVHDEEPLGNEREGRIALAEDGERAAVVAVLAEGDELAAPDTERGGGPCVDEIAARIAGGCGNFRLQGVH
jgi:hypothetical protein